MPHEDIRTRAVGVVEDLGALALRCIRELGQMAPPGSQIRRAAAEFSEAVDLERKGAVSIVQQHEWMRQWRGTRRGGRTRAEDLKKQGEETRDKVQELEAKLRAENTPERSINKKIATALKVSIDTVRTHRK